MAKKGKPAEETDDQTLEKGFGGFGVPEGYESAALEELGGPDALPLAHKPVPPTPAEQKYLLAPRSGGEVEQYEALLSELQQNIEDRIRGENSGMTDEEVSEKAGIEAGRFRFLPPYRAPDTDLQTRLGRGVISKVIGRRSITMPDQDDEPVPIIERMIKERQRDTQQIEDMTLYEALGHAYKGVVPTQTGEEVESAGLFLEDDSRATEEQLKWGTIGGATVGGIAARSTINAAKIAAAAGRGAPMGPWGIAASVGGNVLLGSAIGYFGTGIAYSYDQDDFWDTVEFAGDPEGRSSLGLVVPKGLAELSARGATISGGYDVASAIMGLSSNWTEEDKIRYSRLGELASPGMNFDAFVGLQRELDRVESGEVEADEEHIKQLEAAYMNTYLSLSIADLPKQVMDDYRVEVERAVISLWPKKSRVWASRQVERMTTLSAQSLRNLVSARPLLEDRKIHGLQQAIGRLKAGADDADVEQMLRTIPLGQLMEVGLLITELNADGKKFRAPVVPMSKHHMKILTKTAKKSIELQKATGGDSTKILERSFTELMLSRVEDEHGAINYVESNAGRFMRVMMGAQELFLELPIPYVTPAGIDRAYGLGIRASGTSYLDNVLGAVASGTGGLTMNTLMMMTRAGWDRESAAYKGALLLSVGADFLFPWEEASIYVPYTAMRSAWRMGTIPRRVLPAGVSKTRLAAAMVSPSAYRLYHKLVYGKENAPMYSDPYSVAHHVIDSMVREAIIKGDMHKTDVPKLIESQLKLVYQRLGVEGGYTALKEQVMRVSEETFGSMLSSIHDIIENGTATHRGLRSTPGYQSAVRQVKKMVEAGNLKKDGAALYMALLEIQAVRFSQDPNLPQFKSPEDYFNKIQHLVGGEPGPNAKYSGIHPEVRNVGAETLGRVHGERVTDADAVPSPEEPLSIGDLDIHSILRLSERLGIETDAPAFQTRLEELGFPELPLHSQEALAVVYSAMQRGHFGGDPAKLPQPVEGKLPRNPLDYDKQSAGPILPGMDLAAVERALVGSEVEHGAWFDGITAQQVGRREGTPTHVPLRIRDYIRSVLHGNLIFTHVHPNGGFFSVNDILACILGDFAELRAINAVGGEPWALSRPEGGWGKKWNLAERVRAAENPGQAWRDFATGPEATKLREDLLHAIYEAKIHAALIHAEDILDATGDVARADRFDDNAYRYIIEDPSFGDKEWIAYVEREPAYNAEKFKVQINEETAYYFGEALRKNGIEVKFRGRDSGRTSKPGLAPESDVGSVAVELEGILAGWKDEARVVIDIEAEQTGLFGGRAVGEADEALAKSVGSRVANRITAAIEADFAKADEWGNVENAANAYREGAERGHGQRINDATWARVLKAVEEEVPETLLARAPEAPETVATEALTEPVAEAIADMVEAPGGIEIDPAGTAAALEAGGEVSTGQLGADLGRMIELLGASMYKGDIAGVAVKELTQNSFDGIKRAYAEGTLEPGEGLIDVELNLQEQTITLTDTGSGMTADTVQKAFFTIGGTDKGALAPGESSGGLGMAKIQFLFSSKRIELTTVRNGVKTSVDTNPVELKTGRFEIRQESTSEPNGTKVRLTLPREIQVPGSAAKKVTIPSYGAGFLDKPLIGDVKIRQRIVDEYGGVNDMSPVEKGYGFQPEKTPLFTTAKFDWGTADIYLGIERASSPSIEVLSAGLYQFDWYADLANKIKKKLPHDIIIDVKPSVKPEHPNYAFNNQREGFRPSIEEDLKALSAYLIGHGRGLEAEAVSKVFEDTISMDRVDLDEMFEDIEGQAPRAPREVPARKLSPEELQEIDARQGAWDKKAEAWKKFKEREIEISEGEVSSKGKTVLDKEAVENVYKAKKSFRVKEEAGADAAAKSAADFFESVTVDPKKPLFHNNTNLEFPESAQPMLAKLGTVVVEFRERIAKLYGYEDLDTPGVIYATGLSVDKEYAGIHIRVPYKAFFLNPFSNIAKNADGVLGAWMYILVHEAAHFKAAEHGDPFVGEEFRLFTKLADSGDLKTIESALERILETHWDEYIKLKGEYERSTTRNIAKSLEDGDRLPGAKEPGPSDRVPGARGEDIEAEGAPVRRPGERPERGGVVEPEPGGATVIEAIHSNLVGARGVEAEAPSAAKLPDELYSLASGGMQAKGLWGEIKVPTVHASRRLNTILKQYYAGKITESQFHRRLMRLADEMEEVKELKEDKRYLTERVRGADMAREKLIGARRVGDLDAETVDLALWLIDKNPALAEDLSVSIRKVPEEQAGRAAGLYRPLPRIVQLFKGQTNPTTAVHEILHHSERMMPIMVQAGIRRSWAAALTRELKNATPEQVALLQKMLNRESGAAAEIAKAFKDGVLDRSRHYQFVNPSEFWAVNGSRILSGRYAVKGKWVAAAKQWLIEFIEKIKGLLGMESDAAVLKGLKAVLDGDGTFVSRLLLSGPPSTPLRAPPAERIGLTYLERAHDGNYRTVHVDPRKFDADWAKDTDYYVPSEGRNPHSEQKYQRFLDFARSGKPVEVPLASFTDNPDKPLSFTDGRHRFAVLRDQGVDAIPVQVPAADAPTFAARYGVEPGTMKPDVDNRGPTRLLAGLNGAPGEMPEVGLRHARYRKLLGELKKLQDEVIAKQAGKYTEVQEASRGSIHTEIDRILTEVYNIFKPDLHKVLSTNAHPDDIKLASVRGPDLDEGGLPGWGGEPGHPFVQVDLSGDLDIIRGRLAQFSKAYGQESLVLREPVGASDLPPGYLDDISAPFKGDIPEPLLFRGAYGETRAATMRIELNEAIMARAEFEQFLRVAELERAGISVIRQADVIELVYVPELAKRPVSPGEFLSIARHAAASLSDFAETKNLGPVAVGHIRENIHVSAPEGGQVHGEYTVRGYDDVIGEGLNAEELRHASRTNADLGVEAGVRGARRAKLEEQRREDSDASTPGRSTNSERLPDPTPARQSAVVRELTSELGVHLDREGGKPHARVGEVVKERLEQSGLSKAGIEEATKRLQPDNASPLKSVSKKVEIELALSDDPGAAPRKLEFEVKLVRTDASTAFVPGGLEGTFSFPDLDYVTRRPILLDPKLDLSEIKVLPSKEAARLRRTYKGMGLPEQLINDALGFSLPDEVVYTASDIAGALRAAGEAYDDLTVALYRKHLSSMGTAQHRPAAPKAGETPSQDYIDRLNVHAMDQLGIIIMAMTSAGTNITENQLLASAIRPRTRQQLREVANMIRDGRARKTRWYEERAAKIKRYTPDELQGQDLDALSEQYIEVGLPRDAAEQLVGRGEMPYSEKDLARFLKEAKTSHSDFTREEAQYLIGMAITAGSASEAKYIPKGLLGQVRGGGFRKWWEPGSPFQEWEWDAVRNLNERSYQQAKDTVVGKIQKLEAELDVLRAELDIDRGLLKTEKGKARKTSIRRRIKQQEEAVVRKDTEYASLRAFLLESAGEFIPGAPVPRLTEGFVSRSQVDPRFIANLISDFEADLARVESGKQRYLWYERHPDETFDSFIMRIQSSAKGMGTKTSSFALALTDPLNADVAAIDVHMIRKYWRKIVPDAKNRLQDWYKAWQKGRGAIDPGGGAPAKVIQARGDVDFKTYFKDYSSDWVQRVQAMLAPRPVKVQPRGIEIDVAARKKELKMARASLRAGRTAGVDAGKMEKLARNVEGKEALLRIQQAVSKWDKLYPDHPALQAIKDSEARVATDAYERAVKILRDDPVAKDEGLSTFGVQWMRWDQIRRYYEPEMTAAPGSSAIPGQSTAALMELRRELAELHFFRNPGKSLKDPGVRLYSHTPGSAPRIAYYGGPEKPGGSFEIDAKTGEMMIRMYETGDIGVLFHENGHLIEALLGPQWKEELYSHYPTKFYPELVEQDVKAGVPWPHFGTPFSKFPGRRLAPAASEQMAEAWKWFILTRVGPGGPVRRKYMELYRTMQDWWLRTRNQPEVLPGKMRDLFDMYFRPTDVAVEGAIGLSAAAWEGRFPRVNLDADMGKRISEGKVGEAQQKMGWEAIDLREEHIRQAMNVPEDLKDIDAIDLFARGYAYVATEQIRKDVGPMGLVSITDRSHVPVNRVKRINAAVRDKLIYYMQTSPDDLSKRIITEVRGGKEFEVIELGEAEAAGFKRLVEDMAGEPMGNIIYARMLEPDYDYSRPTPLEYRAAIEVMKDVVAGAGARKTGYSTKISSSLGYAVWNVFRASANNLSDDKSIAIIKKTRNWIKKVFYVERDVSHLDPVAQTITRSFIRRIVDAPDWARRRAIATGETLRADPAYADAPAKEMQIHTRILDDLRESLEWPVHPSKVWLEESKSSPLLDMNQKFNDLHRVEETRRFHWDKENPDKFPNAEQYADFTTEELFADLNQIKLLLREQGQFLTENVAKAIDTLEIYKKRLRTTALEDLDELQQFELGGAIDEIHYALNAKVDTVTDRVSDMASSITGSDASGIQGGLNLNQQMQLYNWFFTGQFEKMIDFVSNRGYHTGLEKNRMSRLDMSEVMLEMIIRMKAHQEFNGMLEELTRYNLRFDVRDLDTAKEFGPNFDRTAYAERVKHYLKQQVAGDRSVRAMWDGGKQMASETPNAPDPSQYPVRDRISGPTDQQRNLHDMRAYFKAMEIIDRWGVGTFVGAWDTFKFPDGTETIIPVEATNALRDALDRAAGVGTTYGRTSWAKSYLPERKGLPVRNRQVLDGLERKGQVIAYSAVSKALNWMFQLNPLTASRIKMGITTGIVIPILPYYVGVGIGAMFQMYQGLGVKAVGAMARNPRQVMAVVARLWKEGGYRPNAPAIVTKDGRIYTMDEAAGLAQRYSLNQSFVSVETAGAVADDIAKLTPRGTVDKLMSGFTRWQDTLIESATAIDNYFRVATFVDALKAGQSAEAAAALARKVGFDYSALSEFERTQCRNIILFYSYMRKNMDLFWDTLLTNPSRVIGQLRLMRGIHQANLEDDPELVIRDHLKLRLSVYFKGELQQNHVNKQVMWIVPPLPVSDAIAIYIDLFGSIDAMTSEARDTQHLRGLTSRLTPWVQAWFVYSFNEDIFFERDLDKYNRVPAWFVELDYLITGGMLVEDVLNVTQDPMYDPATEDFQGYGFYHAKNGKNWWIFRRLLQTPGFGRSMDVWESVDRSNIGAVEYGMEAARAYRMWGVREGFLDHVKPAAIKLPSEIGGIDPTLGVPALAGPRRHYDLSGPEEFSAFFGVRPVPIVREDVQWVQYLRRHTYDIKDQLEKEKKGDIRKRR